MATPFDRIVAPSRIPFHAGADEDRRAGHDRPPFPGHLPDALLDQGWAIEDYFGQPAAYHREHGVVTLSDDGFMACPRNGRPHTGFPDLDNACRHCVMADPAAPDSPCPLASALGDMVSGPSLLIASAVAILAFVVNLWVRHGGGWPL